MVSRHNSEAVLSPELDAIAAAAADLLRAQAGDGAGDTGALEQRVREAASAAIMAGADLDAIADAQRVGQNRARQDLSKDVLRSVARAAKSKRDADNAYDEAIRRAGRVGLSHREIAAEAHVSHGTVRAILTRTAPSDTGQTVPVVAGHDTATDGDHDQT